MPTEREIKVAAKAVRRALKRFAHRGACYSPGELPIVLFDGDMNTETLARVALAAAERERDLRKPTA